MGPDRCPARKPSIAKCHRSAHSCGNGADRYVASRIVGTAMTTHPQRGSPCHGLSHLTQRMTRTASARNSFGTASAGWHPPRLAPRGKPAQMSPVLAAARQLNFATDSRSPKLIRHRPKSSVTLSAAGAYARPSAADSSRPSSGGAVRDSHRASIGWHGHGHFRAKARTCRDTRAGHTRARQSPDQCFRKDAAWPAAKPRGFGTGHAGG